ncbi:phage late control D family protein [Streptomyces tagetis]|uniref:Phage late control D family protein n=1 Tax=Streptomyces tagetis TaxID=2820809 RepID=A0A940XL24_9ACTN|nr:contractile injection system protein, VgrG/Pvc8 family [Streptomyces sp. RG38]MBQ0826640.1 phage late control D family protein [Streptomyces sp. RG38]
MTDRLIASDPVFTVAGQRVPDLARDCLALSVEETTAGLRTLTAHFLAVAPRRRPNDDVVEYLDGRTLSFGSELSVSLGPPGNERVVFAGSVSALEATFDEGDTPHVTVFAEDALMALRMTRRSRTYGQVSDADLARRIAADHGLSADADAAGPTYPLVQQVNESDLAFVRARAALLGAEVWVTGRTLHFATRDRRRGPELRLAQGRDLLTVAVRADLAHQRSAVRVSGYDARGRDRIDAEADGAVVTAEVPAGRTGPAVLAGTVGPRLDQLTRMVPLAEAEGRSWAAARLRARARRFVTAVGTSRGTPELTVGSRITLTGVGRPFDGDGYYTTRVRHTFQRGAGGLRSHFEAERATVNAEDGR